MNWRAPFTNYKITAGWNDVNYLAQFGMPHHGIDFVPTDQETEVKAVISGTVVYVVTGWQDKTVSDKQLLTGGNQVWIQEDNSDKVYRHLHFESISVAKGQHVAQGDSLGVMGQTGLASGPHSHIGLNLNGMGGANSPIDPIPYFQQTINLSNNTMTPEQQMDRNYIVDLIAQAQIYPAGIDLTTMTNETLHYDLKTWILNHRDLQEQLQTEQSKNDSLQARLDASLAPTPPSNAKLAAVHGVNVFVPATLSAIGGTLLPALASYVANDPRYLMFVPIAIPILNTIGEAIKKYLALNNTTN